MSRGFSSVLKTVAMIAVPFIAAVAAPFVAPLIGGALGTIGLSGIGTALGLGGAGVAATGLGSGLTGAALGAGLGAATGAATGRGALMGAITGGLGGGLGAAAGLGQAVGLAPSVAGAPLNLPGAILAGTATSGGAMAPVAGGIGAAATGIGGAASPVLSNVIGNLANKFIQGIDPGGLADLGMTMYNKPPDGLTEEEKRAVYETAQLANTNKELFAQRVEQANAVWNTAQANPEKAYAEAVSGVERNRRESQRQYGMGKFGGTGSERRQAGLARAGAIEALRAGSAAVAGETSRAQRDMSAAAGLLPTSAPIGPAAATLPLFQAEELRQQKYQEQLARASGGLFGGIYNKNRTPQFSISYGQ